jgi:FAD/FMN-containing dehydrogenase
MPPQPHRTELTAWGRFPVVEGLRIASEDLPAVTADAALSRGLGRSYGDSSLPAGTDDVVVDTTLADRILAFDRQSGVLRAEAGLSLFELNRLLLRECWFTPVSPGTQFVTLGGMVASDVHGKNHHVDGCFGEHVRQLKLRLADGRIVECSDEQERELFCATIGGMGLTGHILEVELAMRNIPSPWIFGESERIADLDAMVAGLKQAAADWPMTVGWIDCLARGRDLGRGILMKGRWAQPDEAPERTPAAKRRFRVPMQFPNLALCRASMKAFNLLYYWKHVRRVKHGIEHPASFFYPLDVLDDWNLIYGRRGFTQYQCVLPHAKDNGPARRFLERFVALGGMGFLCVIKDCGPEGKGMLSFPRRGISIAMDFPIHPKKTQPFVDRLNELVIEEGGRIYLTKDTFTRAEHFRAMEPRLDAFNAVRRKWDPQGKLRSAQSVRLLGDTA